MAKGLRDQVLHVASDSGVSLGEEARPHGYQPPLLLNRPRFKAFSMPDGGEK